MQHPIRLLIGTFLVILGVMGVWSASQSQSPQISDVPPEPVVSPTPTPPQATLTNAFWQATVIGDQVALSEAPVTAVFTEDGNLSGSDGCNAYQSQYSVGESNELTIDQPFTSTRQACSESLNPQAAQYIELLISVNSYEILGSNLNLMKDGEVILIFTAKVDPLIAAWDVTQFADATNALNQVLTGTTMTVEFTNMSTVFGSSGCNNYTAEFTNQGGQISISPPASTLMFCETPVGIADQETAFISTLQQVASYSVSGDVLELSSADGVPLIVAQMQTPIQ